MQVLASLCLGGPVAVQNKLVIEGPPSFFTLKFHFSTLWRVVVLHWSYLGILLLLSWQFVGFLLIIVEIQGDKNKLSEERVGADSQTLIPMPYA